MKKLKGFPFESSIMKYIVVCPTQARFAANWFECIDSRSASSTCCLLKSIAIIL